MRLGSGSPVNGLGSFSTQRVIYLFICKYEEETFFIYTYKQELEIVSLSSNCANLDSSDCHMLLTSIFYGIGASLARKTVIIVLSVGVFTTQRRNKDYLEILVIKQYYIHYDIHSGLNAGHSG